MTMSQILVALTMVAVAVVLVVWFRGYLETGSRRRMKSMLKSVGLDPAMADQADSEAIMREARRRCRRCASEDVCERWLAGEEKGENDFCPNAQVFELLKQQAGSTA